MVLGVEIKPALKALIFHPLLMAGGLKAADFEGFKEALEPREVVFPCFWVLLVELDVVPSGVEINQLAEL